MKHKCKIQNGKIKLQDSEEFRKTLESFNGKVCDITIQEHKSTRSIRQNSYYWGVLCKVLGQELGYHPDEIHEVLKFKFASSYIRIKGEMLRGAKSTTKMTTKDFKDYIEEIRLWSSSELNIYIPEPNDIIY